MLPAEIYCALLLVLPVAIANGGTCAPGFGEWVGEVFGFWVVF